MNYYPARGGWTLMWTQFSAEQIRSDLRAIASLHANTVRIIVSPQAFGYPQVLPQRKADFDAVLDLAREQRLSVQLSLFDLWSNYADISGSTMWLRQLLAGHQEDPVISLVEVRNEVVPSPTAIAWIHAMLRTLGGLLPGVARTVSMAGRDPERTTSFFEQFTASELDVVDIHFYGPPVDLLPLINAAREAAAGRPVLLGEVGYPTLPAQGTEGEQTEADYFRLIAQVTRDVGMPPPAPWILSDFAAGAIPPQAGVASQREYHFGLRRLDGTWKPAATVVRAMFSGGDLG